MADEIDLAALRSGEKDMVHRDLRGQKFSDLDLSGCDFSKTHLEGCDFFNVNLEGCVFNNIHAIGVSFRHSNLKNVKTERATIFVNAKFTDCSLEGAKFLGCHFTNTSFNSSNLSASDFSSSHINDGCDFAGTITTEQTKFDGVFILRSIAKAEAFRYYSVDRGKLIRVQDPAYANSVKRDVQHGATQSLLEKLNGVLSQISEIELLENRISQDVGFGHNSGAMWSASSVVSIAELRGDLNALKSIIINSDVSDAESVKGVVDNIESANSRISAWVGDRLTKFADSLVSELGKSAGDWKIYAGMWVVLSGKIDSIIDIVGTFVRHGGLN